MTQPQENLEEHSEVGNGRWAHSEMGLRVRDRSATEGGPWWWGGGASRVWTLC